MSFVINELEGFLSKGNAHVSFEKAIGGVAADLVGKVPEGVPYSLWQLVEHIRVVQWDILEFSRNPKHVSPDWPEGYWPKEKAPAHAEDFKKSVDKVVADRK
ncbi:MAG TPA: DinB family protein, partial [Puia sp.]